MTNEQAIEVLKQRECCRECVGFMLMAGRLIDKDADKYIQPLLQELKGLSPVTLTHGTCKDCTNYVAGALDEEICLRGHELIHKDFYCADFKKRGNEE